MNTMYIADRITELIAEAEDELGRELDDDERDSLVDAALADVSTVEAHAPRLLPPVRRSRMLRAYSPDQPRDRGRFAFAPDAGAGGGGGGRRFLDKVKSFVGLGPKAADDAPASFNDKLSKALADGPNRTAPHGFPIATVDGKEYMVKQRLGGRPEQQQEILASQLGREIGLNIAEAREATVNGRQAAVIEYHEGAQSITQLGSDAARDALAATPRSTVENHALFDYVIGNSDSNDGNTLFKDGVMIAIDKEFGLNETPDTVWLSPPYLKYLDPTNSGGGGFRFSRSNVENMIAKGENVARRLSELGHAKRAEAVQQRLKVMRRFAELPDGDLTAANLEYQGQTWR